MYQLNNNNMITIVKSATVSRHAHINNVFVVKITLTSNKIIEYNFDSLKLARQYCNDIGNTMFCQNYY